MVLVAQPGVQLLATLEDERMNSTPHAWVILALFLTSMVVRVMPVFVKLRLSETVRKLFERVLPMAVFLNFAVYIAIVEIKQAPGPAVAAFGLCFLIIFSTRAGLIFTTLVGTALWFTAYRLFSV